jgi:hypothetical protein
VTVQRTSAVIQWRLRTRATAAVFDFGEGEEDGKAAFFRCFTLTTFTNGSS